MQNEVTLEKKNVRAWAGTPEASLTDRIQEREERMSVTEDKVEEMDTSVKKNVKLKNSWYKTSGTLGHFKNDQI